MFDWLSGCTPDQAFSIALSKLEPLAGASLAVGLAYLNLEKFRYRRGIREKAKSELERLQSNGGYPENFRKMNSFKRIMRLASLEDNDSNDPNRGKYNKAKLPNGIWSKCYTLLFEKHQDRNFAILSAAFSLFVLVSGVCFSIGQIPLLQCFFPSGSVAVMFWALVICLCAPILFVKFGNKVIGCMWQHINEDIEDLESSQIPDAQTAKISDLSAPDHLKSFLDLVAMRRDAEK